MSDNKMQGCDFCRGGPVITRQEQMAFRQWTDKGYVHCRVLIPVGVCRRCGGKNWNDAAEAIIEEAVRQAYEKLP